MPDLHQSWDRIETWYRENALKAETVFGSVWEGDSFDWALPIGASEARIAQAEQAMLLRFPDELRISFLLHDGSGHAILPWGYLLLSQEEMVRAWKMLRDLFEKDNWEAEPQGPIRPVHWNIHWIPVASNESGDYHFVDLDPSPGGLVGQVIKFHHELGPVRILASSFGVWLEEYADRLEAGVYYYDAYECQVRRDDEEEY